MKNNFIVQGNIVVIELTQGQTMRVEKSAIPLLSPHRWRAKRDVHTWYAVTNVRLSDGYWSRPYAHRILMGLDFGDPREVDHLDGNGLNNIYSNLRVTDKSGNQYNQRRKRPQRIGKKPTSNFSGVSWNSKCSKWHTQIQLAGRKIHIGYYVDEFDAAKAYSLAKTIRDAGGTREEIIEKNDKFRSII